MWVANVPSSMALKFLNDPLNLLMLSSNVNCFDEFPCRAHKRTIPEIVKGSECYSKVILFV
jgi:hypothetical protein